jgi:hypothetical protein
MPTKCEKCGSFLYGKNSECLVCSGEINPSTEMNPRRVAAPAQSPDIEKAPSSPPPYYQPLLPQRSGMATAALVLGLIGCIPIAALAGIVVGIVALMQIKKSEEVIANHLWFNNNILHRFTIYGLFIRPSPSMLSV